MAADPFVVHVARLRRKSGLHAHEVRRGEVALAGPLHEQGVDKGRSVMPTGAEAEVDVELVSFEGGIEVEGTGRARGWASAGAAPSPWRASSEIPVHERFADAPVAGPSDEDFLPDRARRHRDSGPALVRDAVVLELPMAPLCKEDCVGLLPQCTGQTATRATRGW